MLGSGFKELFLVSAANNLPARGNYCWSQCLCQDVSVWTVHAQFLLSMLFMVRMGPLGARNKMNTRQYYEGRQLARINDRPFVETGSSCLWCNQMTHHKMIGQTDTVSVNLQMRFTVPKIMQLAFLNLHIFLPVDREHLVHIYRKVWVILNLCVGCCHTSVLLVHAGVLGKLSKSTTGKYLSMRQLRWVISTVQYTSGETRTNGMKISQCMSGYIIFTAYSWGMDITDFKFWVLSTLSPFFFFLPLPPFLLYQEICLWSSRR